MANRDFNSMLETQWSRGRWLSVGLDPEPDRLPRDLQDLPDDKAILEFLRQIIEATSDYAAAYKPNSAHFEALGDNGYAVLRDVIEIAHEIAPDVPVILDAKRADIGNTNEKYAVAAFDYLKADAITVHPYLGPEAMKPFLDRADKGVIVLARTSNPGAGRYQDLSIDGKPLYQHIAGDVSQTWNTNGNCGLVVGATYPNEMKLVREVAPDLPILVPGIGAQGGDIKATIENGGDKLLLHASRSLLYAFENGGSVKNATTSAARQLTDEINSHRI